jgi:nucleotide-binding universal stress UspA family protein
VPANNPLYAVMNMAKTLGAQELVVGASNKYTAEEHLDQMAFYWINLHGGQQAPLTIRVLSKTWDVHYDIGGGCRIPRITERKARTVAELRAAGVGVRRVVMVHENTAHATDLFDTVLTMLDPDVTLDLAWLAEGADAQADPTGATASNLAHDVERAGHLGREIEVHRLTGDPAHAVVKLAIERDYDLIVLNDEQGDDAGNGARKDWHDHVREHAACPVCFVALPAIQREVVDSTPSQ